MKNFRDIIDEYYNFRKYVEPEPVECLLWLLSEVGELCQTFKTNHPVYYMPIRRAVLAGLEAEQLMARDGKKWVRNNQNQSIPDMSGEIADVYMMLDRFAKAQGLVSPEECLKIKMKSKGFDIEEEEN